MKKRGIVTGILFAVMLAFVFQAEIGGFFASVRDKAFTAANEDIASVAETTAKLPDLEETEKKNETDGDAKQEGEEEAAPTEETKSTAADITYKEVSLFFVDKNNQELATETRNVINQVGLAKTTVQELLTGPSAENLASYIPAGTTVQSINIEKSGLCTVDFSKEIQNTAMTSSEEKYVIESIVNTLSQFDSVNAVQIRVNGAVVDSIAGHWDISRPLSANE